MFGLHGKFTDIRTELLKTDKHYDDIVQVAHVFETTASANTLISKAQQEQVKHAATCNPRGPPKTTR